MIEEVRIYIPGGSHDGGHCERRERFEALFNDLGRGNQPVEHCAGDNLRTSRQAAVGWQGAGTIEVSSRRSKDRRYPPRDQVAANHLRAGGASLPQPNPRLRRHVCRARKSQ